MGEFIPALMEEGKQPRVMLDYSGTLLHGLWKMGLHDVFDSLRRITCEPRYSAAVEWLGCPWGHAVAPSTVSISFFGRVKVRGYMREEQSPSSISLKGFQAHQRLVSLSCPKLA